MNVHYVCIISESAHACLVSRSYSYTLLMEHLSRMAEIECEKKIRFILDNDRVKFKYVAKNKSKIFKFKITLKIGPVCSGQ